MGEFKYREGGKGGGTIWLLFKLMLTTQKSCPTTTLKARVAVQGHAGPFELILRNCLQSYAWEHHQMRPSWRGQQAYSWVPECDIVTLNDATSAKKWSVLPKGQVGHFSPCVLLVESSSQLSLERRWYNYIRDSSSPTSKPGNSFWASCLTSAASGFLLW